MIESHNVMHIWTVYDHPRDRPDAFVARRWEITPGQAQPTDDVLVSADLETIRQQLATWGFVAMLPSPEDDPAILETWL